MPSVGGDRKRLYPILAVALAMLCFGASRFGVVYESAQFQLREHPETWMLANPGSDDTAHRRMRSEVIASREILGTHVELRRFEERPTLLLQVGATIWLVASSNYAHLLLQNLDVLARPWLSPPWNARALSITLGVAYLALAWALVGAAFGRRVAFLTTCLVAGHAFFLWQFGSGHTHVIGTLVLFFAALYGLWRSTESRSVAGGRLWLALAFFFLVFALSAKITAIGYLAAVGVALLYRAGVRQELRVHRAQWSLAALAVVVAWSALLASNVFLMDRAFYASDGKLMVNLGRALHAPWGIAMPVLHQLAILTAAPVVYASRGGPFVLALLLLPVPLYLGGAVGLVRRLRRTPERTVRACLLCNALLLGQAGLFYYGDHSFDLLLMALPLVVAVLVHGLLELLPADPSWEAPLALAVAALSGAGSVLGIGGVPLYGFDLETQEALLRKLDGAHPAAVVTIDPMTAYALKWMQPDLHVVYFQGAHQQLRHAADRPALPALRAFLEARHADVAVVPERPLFEMPRRTPWADVRAAFDDYYGRPELVRDGEHDGVLVYGLPRRVAR